MLCTTSFFASFRAIKSLYTSNSGIFHHISLIWVDDLIGKLAHYGCFVESGQNQLELSWIRIDIPNGEHPWEIGLVIFCVVHLDGIFSISSPQLPNGPNFGDNPNKGIKKSVSTYDASLSSSLYLMTTACKSSLPWISFTSAFVNN